MLSAAVLVARALLGALAATLRIETRGEEHLTALRRERRPVLFSVWHGRLLVPVLRHRAQGLVAMISRSRDGDFAARLLARLGYEAVRGSSSRGGNEAFHALLDALRAGRDGAVIPDGPRGPARELKPGLLHLAQRAGAAVLPLSAAARPAHLFASWDRFLLPLPFARAVVVYGPPVVVPPELSPEQVNALAPPLASTLSRLEREADAALHPPREATP